MPVSTSVVSLSSFLTWFLVSPEAAASPAALRTAPRSAHHHTGGSRAPEPSPERTHSTFLSPPPPLRRERGTRPDLVSSQQVCAAAVGSPWPPKCARDALPRPVNVSAGCPALTTSPSSNSTGLGSTLWGLCLWNTLCPTTRCFARNMNKASANHCWKLSDRPPSPETSLSFRLGHVDSPKCCPVPSVPWTLCSLGVRPRKWPSDSWTFPAPVAMTAPRCLHRTPCVLPVSWTPGTSYSDVGLSSRGLTL